MARDQSPSDDEHKWKNIQGVQSIEWLFRNKSSGKKESIRRQALKDNLGKVHTDTVMLDTVSKGAHHYYCDAIIYSDYIQ